MAEVCIDKPFKDEDLTNVGKKELIKFLQENSSVRVRLFLLYQASMTFSFLSEPVYE